MKDKNWTTSVGSSKSYPNAPKDDKGEDALVIKRDDFQEPETLEEARSLFAAGTNGDAEMLAALMGGYRLAYNSLARAALIYKYEATKDVEAAKEYALALTYSYKPGDDYPAELQGTGRVQTPWQATLALVRKAPKHASKSEAEIIAVAKQIAELNDIEVPAGV